MIMQGKSPVKMFRSVSDLHQSDPLLIDQIMKVPVHGGTTHGRMLLHHPLEHLFGVRMVIGSHEPNPLEEKNCRDLEKAVLANHSDVGVIYDGDADRVMFIDERGRFLQPDYITAVIGSELLSKEKGNSLVDIRTSRSTTEYLAGLGSEVTIWKVGHAFAKMKIREIHGCLGSNLAVLHINVDETDILQVLASLDDQRIANLFALLEHGVAMAINKEVNAFDILRDLDGSDAVGSRLIDTDMAEDDDEIRILSHQINKPLGCLIEPLRVEGITGSILRMAHAERDDRSHILRRGDDVRPDIRFIGATDAGRIRIFHRVIHFPFLTILHEWSNPLSRVQEPPVSVGYRWNGPVCPKQEDGRPFRHGHRAERKENHCGTGIRLSPEQPKNRCNRIIPNRNVPFGKQRKELGETTPSLPEQDDDESCF